MGIENWILVTNIKKGDKVLGAMYSEIQELKKEYLK